MTRPDTEQNITVTKKQNEYLLQLADGPKTTNDLMRSIMVSMETVGRMMRRLKDVGLVKSEKTQECRGNQKEHSLKIPYVEMIEKGLTIKENIEALPITEQEILYAAILRNAGLTGQRLSKQYTKIFQKRNPGAIKNIVLKARKQGLCR